MKTPENIGRPPNRDDPLDPSFNPDEEPSYPESEPENVPLPDQPLPGPPAIAPITMQGAFAAAAIEAEEIPTL